MNGPLTIRLKAEPGKHAKLYIEYKKDNKWIVIREVTGWTFARDENVDIGVMACSPSNSSFRAEFWDIIAQDYSELALEQGPVWVTGQVNPTLNPYML